MALSAMTQDIQHKNKESPNRNSDQPQCDKTNSKQTRT